MTATVLAFAKGFGLYAFLCAVALLAGRGLLRLLRPRMEEHGELVLAPVLTFLFWSLTLGITGGLRLPTKFVAPWLWGATVLLALCGLRRPWPRFRVAGLPVLVCLALPVVVMADRFGPGLTQYAGTAVGDGYAYIAGGQYYWEYPRGFTDDLGLLHRYGATFKDHRYLSFTLLGFLSPLVRPGDTLAVAALFQAWVLFTAACAFWSFWAAHGQGPRFACAATALAVVNGWTARVVWGNFFDQQLALVYLPALGLLPGLWGVRDPRRWLVTGAAVAALVYTYPVCAPFILAGASALALPLAWKERRGWLDWLYGGSLVTAAAAVLLLPGGTCLVTHLSQQYQLATALAERLGNSLCGGLLDPRSMPAALWALGDEVYGKPHSLGENLAGFVLSALFVIGLVALLRRGLWGVALNLALLGAGTVYFLAVRQFPYAVFKLLTFSWWCVAGAAVLGASRLICRMPGVIGRRGLTAALLVFGLGVNFLATRLGQPLWPSAYSGLRRADFESVRAVRALTQGEPLTVAVDDWQANVLALYVLRETPLELTAHRGWFTFPEIFDRDSWQRGPRPATPYVLTDNGAACMERFCAYGRLVWAAGPYCLWRMEGGPAGAVLVNLDSRAVLASERWGYWVSDGDGEVISHVRTKEAGTLVVFAQLVLGPELAAQGIRDVYLTTDTGWQRRLGIEPGRTRFAVPVHAGMNRLYLRPLDAAGRVPAAPTNMPRPLLCVVGMRVERFAAEPATPELPSQP